MKTYDVHMWNSVQKVQRFRDHLAQISQEIH